VVVAAGFAEDVDVEVAAWFGPFVVLFSTAPTRRDCCTATEHALAMLDAGTFDLHLTAAAATAVPWPRCAPSTASPSWSRSASPAAGIAL